MKKILNKKWIRNRLEKGFTFLEMLISVAILLILSSSSYILLNSSISNAALTSTAEEMISYIELTRSNAVSGKNGSDHGIYLDTTEYTTFEGSTYSSSDPNNYVVSLGNIQISSITLNGGGQALVFEGPLGSTTNDGTFVLSSTTSARSITLTVDTYGNVTY